MKSVGPGEDDPSPERGSPCEARSRRKRHVACDDAARDGYQMSSKPNLMGLGLVLVAALSLEGCSTKDRAASLTSEPGTIADNGSPRGACEDGDLRECFEKLSEWGSAITCKSGYQECQNGAWGPCGHTSVSFSTRHLGISAAVPPACSANPCNPECTGFDEFPTAPISNPSEPGFSFEGNPNEWGNAPGGFEDKQNCGLTTGGCLSGYPKDCGGAPTHYNRFDGCQADHHCDDATNECERNEPGWTWPASVCRGIDLSIGPACHNGQNDGFPVCNRGNTEVPAGSVVKIAITNGNEYDLSKCPPNIKKPDICTMSLTSPLEPGECRRVHGPACKWSGNSVGFVNWDLTVPECGTPLANPPQDATQPGCSNNWSDIKTGAVCETYSSEVYEPLSWTEEYTATCPHGMRPKWGMLVYDATTPCSPGACDGDNTSSVQFEVQSSKESSPTEFTNWVTAVHAPDPPYTHPSSCTTSGPDPCPVSLSSIMQSPGDDHLRLRITLLPSPDQKAAASLNRWQITYNCGAAE